MPNGPSRSFKVTDFGTDRKCECNFLLVINSNLGPILSRFIDIAGFLLRTVTSEFWGFPLGLDRTRSPMLGLPGAKILS